LLKLQDVKAAGVEQKWYEKEVTANKKLSIHGKWYQLMKGILKKHDNEEK